MIHHDLWVCIGSGPSLTQADVDAVRGLGGVIAVNDACHLAPWADALYAADRAWIDRFNGVPTFSGQKYSIESHDTTPRSDWTVMKNTGMYGLELDSSGLRTGFNSGYQAVNLAVHFGAKAVILLGFDMHVEADGRDHFFGSHPDGKVSPYPQMIAAFDTLVAPLKDVGVTVINCTPGSALTCFPCMPLAQALAECAA